MRTEPPPPLGAWLPAYVIAALGTDVLLAALALAELPGAPWGVWLVVPSVACFALAGSLALRAARRAQRD